MTQQTDPFEEIAEVRGDVAAARDAVRTGMVVDLTPLARKAEALCSRLTGMPRAEAVPLAEQLTPLIAALDDLADDITREHEQLKRRLDALSPPENDAR